MAKEMQAANHELLQCFDEEGNVIDPQPRNVVHTEPLSIWHATAGIRIVDKNEGLIFCTKRSEQLDSSPGKWQTDVGGHVKAGSTIEDTAIEELFEEVRIKASPEDLILEREGKIEDLKHFFKVFLLFVDRSKVDIKLAENELDASDWVAMDEIDTRREMYPNAWKGKISPATKEIIREKLRGQ